MGQKQRIDKILAHMGCGSRSEIRRLVRDGAVQVGGRTVKDSGYQIDPDAETLTLSGKPIVYKPFMYVMLNKPQGVISATEDTRDRTVADLLAAEYGHYKPFPVGRLDKDTEGLLLMTNDGKLAHQLLSPRKSVPKTYFAEVEGKVGEGDAKAFAAGVALDDGYVTLPAHLVILKQGDPAEGQLSKVELTITEGKFHQVKRMFQAVGKRVVYLKRIRMGPLLLDEHLALGEYRELTADELRQLGGARGELTCNTD